MVPLLQKTFTFSLMSNFLTDPVAAYAPESGGVDGSTDWLAALKDAPEKNQLQIIQEFAGMGEMGLERLMQFLLDQAPGPSSEARFTSDVPPNGLATHPWKPNLAMGKAYQLLLAANAPHLTHFLQTHFPEGVVPLRSQANIDYKPLQTLLAQQDFQAADQMTLQKFCEVAGSASVQRKWVYFTEVDQFPIEDLHTINALWLVHSEGLFGFTVQREIWLSVGKNWEKFWPKIGWKAGNNWTRYPQEFTWNLTAPRGHLPLSNQLRGVRVIAALMTHPAWTKVDQTL